MTYRRDMLKFLAVLAVLLLPSVAGQAQDATSELPTEPILRIETGKHGALIHRIDTDAENRFAVTASDDKTVRVWSLPEGRLMRVLRLPIDQGIIGKAYAVAISPDGTTVAVGGWTAPNGLNKNIFLFDRASGELRQRLRDLPNVVLSLGLFARRSAPCGIVRREQWHSRVRCWQRLSAAAERYAIPRSQLFGGIRSHGTTGHGVVRRICPALRGRPLR